MSDLLIQAEMEKFAATVESSVAELAFLSHLELADLRAVRKAVSASLFDRHSKRFRRLAESTQLLPNKIVALIAEKVMPASISAQITGLLKPEAAVDLARRLPVSVLADICLELDPRRAEPVLQAMPVETVVASAHELVLRRQFMTMAAFVDALLDEQIRQVSRQLNGEALLRVGFFVESQARLNDLIGMLEIRQLADTIEAAARNDGALWAEALSLAERLSEEQRSRLGSLFAEVSPDIHDSFNQALFERGLWPSAVPLLEAMDDAAQEMVISALASHAEDAPDAEQHLNKLLPLLSERLQKKIVLATGA